MLKISKKQLISRYDALPDNLKEALFSDLNADLVWKICENQHLPKDKILIIATLVGDVILGFIAADDLGAEIKKELGLMPELANAIATEIDRRIFAPIRSDLERVYAPVIAETKEGQLPTEEILDLRKIEAEKREIEAEERRKEAEKEAAAEAPRTEVPGVVSVEEKKEEIGPQQVAEEKIQPQITQPLITELPHEGPVIIHKEDEIKPIAEAKKSLGGLFGFLRKSKEDKISPVKAAVEMGVEEARSARGSEIERGAGADLKILNTRGSDQRESVLSPRESASQKIRVVHYTEAPTPVSPFEKKEEEVKLVEADKHGTTQITETEGQGKIGTEPSGINVAKPPENLPAELPKTEEKPLAEEAKPSKTEPILDLRKSIEEAKSLSEKPPTSPAEPEEKIIIDLSSFR